MRFDLTFFAKSPFLHTIQCTFLSAPYLDANVNALASLGITDLPNIRYLPEDRNSNLQARFS